MNAMQLAEVGRYFAERKWSLATSSNYSCRYSASEILITKSGIDKQYLHHHDDIISVDNEGRVKDENQRSSAETLVHIAIYKHFPDADCVLHTHSALGTRLSLKYLDQGALKFSGYEMLKALSGNTTHDMTEMLPIVANAQDMTIFSAKLPALFKANPGIHGFLIAGHGLYTWGRSLSETKRHVEAFEFLFECLAFEAMGI